MDKVISFVYSSYRSIIACHSIINLNPAVKYIPSPLAGGAFELPCRARQN